MQKNIKKLIAVYGTLKKGRGNHYHLRNARFVGKHTTPAKFTMYNLGGFPAITAEGKTPIKCEIYQIEDDNTLESVYRLEGYTGVRDHPENWYDTLSIDTPHGEAEIFYFKKPLKNTTTVPTGEW